MDRVSASVVELTTTPSPATATSILVKAPTSFAT